MEKKELREIAKKKREAIVANDKPLKISENFLKNIEIIKERVVAAYHPIGSEVDILHLVQELRSRHLVMCLPHMEMDGRLDFRKWEGELVRNKYGIPESKGEILIPDIIIVPCLAFNKQKYRLGYGGGYYDRTLNEYKAKKIGIAYAEQEMEFEPEPHDVKLDLIVTDAGCI